MVIATHTKRRAILIFTLNRSGVLNKIASLIRRKMQKCRYHHGMCNPAARY